MSRFITMIQNSSIPRYYLICILVKMDELVPKGRPTSILLVKLIVDPE